MSARRRNRRNLTFSMFRIDNMDVFRLPNACIKANRITGTTLEYEVGPFEGNTYYQVKFLPDGTAQLLRRKYRTEFNFSAKNLISE